MIEKIPDHLGGQVKGNIDISLIKYIKSEFDPIRTMVDLGCGNGGAVKRYGSEFDIKYTGIDGDWTKLPKSDEFLLHDFTKGKVKFNDPDSVFDLGYSVEFLEHVDEKFQENYMEIFQRCKYVVITAAPPGTPGRHHVNCRDRKYWVKVFENYGFDFLPNITEKARMKSCNKSNDGSPKTQFFKLSGMVFKNGNTH